MKEKHENLDEQIEENYSTLQENYSDLDQRIDKIEQKLPNVSSFAFTHTFYCNLIIFVCNAK